MNKRSPRWIVRKIWQRTWIAVVKLLEPLNPRLYMWFYCRCLRRLGVKLNGTPRYIAPSCWLDGIDYTAIEIGHDVVISASVKVLTHDFAVTRALVALGAAPQEEVCNLRPVRIGDNSFIGMSSVLTPGCTIGKNVIVGAGTVVRGQIPDNAIVIGNPGQIVGDTLAWGRKYLQRVRGGTSESTEPSQDI